MSQRSFNYFFSNSQNLTQNVLCEYLNPTFFLAEFFFCVQLLFLQSLVCFGLLIDFLVEYR